MAILRHAHASTHRVRVHQCFHPIVNVIQLSHEQQHRHRDAVVRFRRLGRRDLDLLDPRPMLRLHGLANDGTGRQRGARFDFHRQGGRRQVAFGRCKSVAQVRALEKIGKAGILQIGRCRCVTCVGVG